MSGLTTYGAEQLLAGSTVPATLWLKFHDDDPGTDGTANAATETTRESLALEPGDDAATAVNDASISWTGLAANESATHFTLWDDETAGNPWFVGEFAPALALVAAGGVTLAAGSVIVTAARHGVS